MPSVSSLHIYPVKSCAPHSVQCMTFDKLGPIGDRRWMIANNRGEYITQRTHPILARIEVEILDDLSIRLSAPGKESIEASLIDESARPSKAMMWDSESPARDAGPMAAEWLSQYIGMESRLLGIDGTFHRTTNLSPSSQVGFADGYPLLIVSQASLDDLNNRLDQAVSMNRFRPNIVISDCEAFDEGTWSRIRLGDVVLKAVSQCSRCIMTTVDPEFAKRTSKEPLQTLSQYRKFDGQVMFGHNYVNESKSGRIQIGMPVDILT